MSGKNKTYSKHCVIALFAIAFPLLISLVKKESRPDLTGIVISEEKPVFSFSEWFNGSYQSAADDYYSDHWAFKEKMVRLNNQFYYDAFNQIRVNKFVSGKDGYVFGEGYIHAAYGDDLMEESKVEELLRKTRVLQDTLKKKGIDLICGVLPGKGHMCEEYIEDKYRHPIKSTNYQYFAKYSKKYNLNTLDLYDYFEKLKPKSSYPLYTKFGHHWSNYAECHAVDLTIKYIELLRNADLPDIMWDKVEISDTARGRDSDILKSMNLLREPELNMQLAYPKLSFEDAPEKNNTRVLVIGDSYWYGPVYMGINQRSFGYGDFWYYYNRVVPTRVTGEKLEVWQLDFKAELERNNVVMLMYADGNIPSYGSGFIEDAYEMYTSPSTFFARKERNRQIQTYAKQIREVPALLKKTTRRSEALMIPLDSAITLDAMKMAGMIVN